MILWAKAESIDQVNDQRVEFIELIYQENSHLPKIKVELCGQPEITKIINPQDICGVEIGEFANHDLDIMFKTTKFLYSYSPPRPAPEPKGPKYTIEELA